jgi:hypothetical protein
LQTAPSWQLRGHLFAQVVEAIGSISPDIQDRLSRPRRGPSSADSHIPRVFLEPDREELHRIKKDTQLLTKSSIRTLILDERLLLFLHCSNHSRIFHPTSFGCQPFYSPKNLLDAFRSLNETAQDYTNEKASFS